jgi:hypothetical protein
MCRRCICISVRFDCKDSHRVVCTGLVLKHTHRCRMGTLDHSLLILIGFYKN